MYEDSFLATANPDGSGFCPTLILVTTRLGIDKINQVYEEALKATLQLPQSLGIAGSSLAPSGPTPGEVTKVSPPVDAHHPHITSLAYKASGFSTLILITRDQLSLTT